VGTGRTTINLAGDQPDGRRPNRFKTMDRPGFEKNKRTSSCADYTRYFRPNQASGRGNAMETPLTRHYLLLYLVLDENRPRNDNIEKNGPKRISGRGNEFGKNGKNGKNRKNLRTQPTIVRLIIYFYKIKRKVCSVNLKKMSANYVRPRNQRKFASNTTFNL